MISNQNTIHPNTEHTQIQEERINVETIKRMISEKKIIFSIS